MTTLAIDIGSSSVKAQCFTDGAAVGKPVRVAYPTRHDDLKVEVDPESLLNAVASAITKAERSRDPDCVALSVMSPAWVAMDKQGNALTPIVTHQDRRSVQIAGELESRVGKQRHLQLAGNRPFPGGISSTTCAWFLKNQPDLMARADLVGHLSTFLHRRLTGARVIDPSNASFTGLYLTVEQGGWSDELCSAVGISRLLLPDILESDQIAGRVTAQSAARFGLTAGTPVLAGMVDTSAAILVTGVADGQLFHSVGSTDVLAVACDHARPHERLLTRALGIGRKWMSVSTLAAAGSSLDWMRAEFFRDLSDDQFHSLAADLMARRAAATVNFEPYLAGERVSLEQKQASFSHLTLSTTREEMLGAVIESLAVASGRRLRILREVQPRFLPMVYVSGGAGALADLMHREWPALSAAEGQSAFEFQYISEATLHGLATLVPKN
jgi:xylulokinase